jgi:hypothetical protein
MACLGMGKIYKLRCFLIAYFSLLSLEPNLAKSKVINLVACSNERFFL